MIDENCQLSIRRQCMLLGVHRSQVYYRLSGEGAENLRLIDLIDRLHLDDPSAGTRRLALYLTRKIGRPVDRKRVRRLMRLMGIEAIYPRRRTTIPGGPSGIQPYLLKGLEIDRPNQVWTADITFVKMRRGFMYLFAIMDWFSRKVIAWDLSNTLDAGFCIDCLKRALIEYGTPAIVNTDQGSQFTSDGWLGTLQSAGVAASMDGRGRWLDNVVIERFWRTVKYEDVYLKVYETPRDLEKGLKGFMHHYNSIRPHSSLAGSTPDEVYRRNKKEKLAA